MNKASGQPEAGSRDAELKRRVEAALGITPDELMDPWAGPGPDFLGLWAWAIVSRKPARTRLQRTLLEPGDFFPDIHNRIAKSDLPERRLLARHAHPVVRLALVQRRVEAEIVVSLVDDEWEEIRDAALTNRGCPRSVLAERCSAEPNQWLRQLAERLLRGEPVKRRRPCVMCGAPRRDDSYSTCSVRCSIDQYQQRIASGLYVRDVDADPRHRLGIRRAWPGAFIREVPAASGSGGLPGAGPRKATVLLSFIRGIPVLDLVDLLGRLILEAGMTALAAVWTAERLAIAGIDEPDAARAADAVRAAVERIIEG
jgi:hypothetical protein